MLLDVWHLSNEDLCIRLVCAVVMGGIIGWEREYSNQSAGFRTHILVCVGSALIMLLSMYGFSDYVNEENVRMDPARLAAQVISGIGFLGAGTILRNGMSISGLTTAASLWVVAAIGLSVGAGFYLPAGIVTLIVFASLFILNHVERRVFKARKIQQITVTSEMSSGAVNRLSELFEEHGVTIKKMTIQDQPNPGLLNLSYSLSGRRSGWVDLVMVKLSECEGVHSVSLQGQSVGVRKKKKRSKISLKKQTKK